MKSLLFTVVVALTALGGVNSANAQSCFCPKDPMFPVGGGYWFYYAMQYPDGDCDDSDGVPFGFVCEYTVCGDGLNCDGPGCGDCFGGIFAAQANPNSKTRTRLVSLVKPPKLPKYKDVKGKKAGLESAGNDSKHVRETLAERTPDGKIHRNTYTAPNLTTNIVIEGNGKNPKKIYAKISKLVSGDAKKGKLNLGFQIKKPNVGPVVTAKGWNVFVPTEKADDDEEGKVEKFRIPGVLYAKVDGDVFIIQTLNSLNAKHFPDEAPKE